ncbi:hypothetical protein WJX74_010621 [Apatococcus lobatus]
MDDTVDLLLHFADQSSEPACGQPGAKSIRWASNLEAHSQHHHTPDLTARPARTCLKQRSKEHTFPHLEEAQAFEGALLLATKISAQQVDRPPFARSIWRTGHKRSRLSRYVS